MGTKFGLLLGLGAGYVFDIHTGREQYGGIRPAVSKVCHLLMATRSLGGAGEKVPNVVRAQDEHITDKIADTVRECLSDVSIISHEVDLCFEDEGPSSR